ncbi:MAG: ECF transporter S component [Deltaproteobacteria bacterium]|nr:ECF transporter S component [Deltaproteobacteria bacterium]
MPEDLPKAPDLPKAGISEAQEGPNPSAPAPQDMGQQKPYEGQWGEPGGPGAVRPPGPRPWKLKDLALLGMIAIAFSVVYLGNFKLLGMIYKNVQPWGLAYLAAAPLFGVRFMAATFAGIALRKPGAAIIAEILTDTLAALMGGYFGPLMYVHVLLVGGGAEAIFLAGRYRDYEPGSMCLAAITCAFLNLLNLFTADFKILPLQFMVPVTIISMFSAVVLAGLLSYLLGRAIWGAGPRGPAEGGRA